MRRTWDALAAAGDAVHVGDPVRGAEELAALFGRLAADPRGGTCLEVGCGPGRMTGALAERFDEVVAVDVSPAMLERAKASVSASNVDFRVISGVRLDSIDNGIADAVVCYLVLQHLPRRRAVLAYLNEFARVLAPVGEAFVQVPVLDDGLRSRAWRVLRSLVVPMLARVAPSPERERAFRGVRLTRGELERGLHAARLAMVAHDEGPSAYRFSRDLFLRLRRA